MASEAVGENGAVQLYVWNFPIIVASILTTRIQLREVKFRDQVSATMIYDDRGVFDYFRYVNDNMVAGIMEGKELGEDGLFYFYLIR